MPTGQTWKVGNVSTSIGPVELHLKDLDIAPDDAMRTICHSRGTHEVSRERNGTRRVALGN